MIQTMILISCVAFAPLEQTEIPSEREYFVRALDQMEKSSSDKFVADLSAFVTEQLAGDAGDTPERTRERRRRLLMGQFVLFDSTDVLGKNPFTRPLFRKIALTDDEKKRRRYMGGWVRFHGRNDAVRHFFISAALTAIAGPAIAERLGRNKEISDSKRFDPKDPTGQGFSFPDLAYNHAGIRFACWCLGWQNRAQLDHPMPPVAAFLPTIEELELPERVGWEEFQKKYYGDKWSEYRKILDRIHARLDASLAPYEPAEPGQEEEPAAPSGADANATTQPWDEK